MARAASNNDAYDDYKTAFTRNPLPEVNLETWRTGFNKMAATFKTDKAGDFRRFLALSQRWQPFENKTNHDADLINKIEHPNSVQPLTDLMHRWLSRADRSPFASDLEILDRIWDAVVEQPRYEPVRQELYVVFFRGGRDQVDDAPTADLLWDLAMEVPRTTDHPAWVILAFVARLLLLLGTAGKDDGNMLQRDLQDLTQQFCNQVVSTTVRTRCRRAQEEEKAKKTTAKRKQVDNGSSNNSDSDTEVTSADSTSEDMADVDPHTLPLVYGDLIQPPQRKRKVGMSEAPDTSPYPTAADEAIANIQAAKAAREVEIARQREAVERIVAERKKAGTTFSSAEIDDLLEDP
jgi:hypothetical protein